MAGASTPSRGPTRAKAPVDPKAPAAPAEPVPNPTPETAPVGAPLVPTAGEHPVEQRVEQSQPPIPILDRAGLIAALGEMGAIVVFPTDGVLATDVAEQLLPVIFWMDLVGELRRRFDAQDLAPSDIVSFFPSAPIERLVEEVPVTDVLAARDLTGMRRHEVLMDLDRDGQLYVPGDRLLVSYTEFKSLRESCVVEGDWEDGLPG